MIVNSWFYIVLHSLPGKAFANGETIWLCNAQYADSKIFSRSLLAKVGLFVFFTWLECC